MNERPKFLVFDDPRLGYVAQSDTAAPTIERARREAEAMARRWRCAVHVFAHVGTVVAGEAGAEWAAGEGDRSTDG